MKTKDEPPTPYGANVITPSRLCGICDLFRVMIPTPQRNTGDRGDRNSTHRLLPTGSLLYVCASSSGRHPRSLAPVTDIGGEYLPPLATAHTLAPVVPVCFNLFRVMIPTPQRNTGDRGDRNSTHRLLPTGSLLYVCASSSGRHHREDRDTGGRQAHRLALSPLYASISFGLPPNPVFWRKVITACYSL